MNAGPSQREIQLRHDILVLHYWVHEMLPREVYSLLTDFDLWIGRVDFLAALRRPDVMNEQMNEWMNRVLLLKYGPMIGLQYMGLSWKWALKEEFKKPYFQQLCWQINNDYSQGIVIHPTPQNVFAFTRYFAVDEVKVVILGQDPYPSGAANGLAFSSNGGIDRSLGNIYKVLEYNSIPLFQYPNHGDLTPWAKQGVVLLNTILTVKHGKIKSHRRIGWERFTDAVIKCISDRNMGVVFLLWGREAKAKKALIDSCKHYILETSHPSPLSAYRGFLECAHFSTANQYLAGQGKLPINWIL